MDKRNKVILGFFTIWPVIYIFVFILVAMIIVLIGIFTGGDEERFMPFLVGGSIILMMFHFATIIVIWVMIIIYIIKVINNPDFEQANKVIWCLLIFFASIIAMPIYWYLYIWKESGLKLT
ncbi:MAG TPA: hypothetical protein ENN73_00450, partial [Firmicutes bacterium]|nr:hypothetical protein [Bacillota bacterium]